MLRKRVFANGLYGGSGWRTGKFQKLVGGFGKKTSTRHYTKAYQKARTAGFWKNTSLSYKGNTFMPREFTTTLRFWGGAERLTSAGGVEDVVMRANSPRDPYFDAGGEEAAGLDELLAIYTTFKVVSCSIRLRVINLDTDDPVHICIFPNISNSDDTSTSSFAQPLSKVSVVTAEQGHAELSNYCTTREMYKFFYPDKDLCGNSGADPTYQWYWHCVFKNYSGNALNLEYDISMEYRVRFAHLEKVSQL